MNEIIKKLQILGEDVTEAIDLILEKELDEDEKIKDIFEALRDLELMLELEI